MTTPYYESNSGLEQYLLFHYGTPEQISPLLADARSACGFPARCVSEPIRHLDLPRKVRALDLGCAVGRSSFELSRHFAKVVGIDFSHRFVAAAKQMGTERAVTVEALREGTLTDKIRLELPRDLPPSQIFFEQGDACNLRPDLGTFDLVLMANLIDRLPDPARCLDRLPELISSGGGLIITSPYTWMEEYTPRDKWLMDEGTGTLGALKRHLSSHFDFQQTINLPFLIREHQRKYQWSVAEASLWRRK